MYGPGIFVPNILIINSNFRIISWCALGAPRYPQVPACMSSVATPQGCRCPASAVGFVLAAPEAADNQICAPSFTTSQTIEQTFPL